MELTKVLDVINYTGRIYYIRPYIWDGKIVRNTVGTAIKETTKYNNFGRTYSLGRLGSLHWDDTIFHHINEGETVDENTVINNGGALRFFTDRESAKKALEDYRAQHVYKLNESIEKELRRLEAEKKKIEDNINKLKERRKECFKSLSTNFIKKS